MLKTFACLAALLAAAALAVTASPADARKATPTERQALIEQNVVTMGYGESGACANAYITRVSRYKPRFAVVLPHQQRRVALGCTMFDGYAVYRRPTTKSNLWRYRFAASDPPPCSVLPPRAAKELKFEGCMSGGRVRT
jgi:hypothetical protein